MPAIIKHIGDLTYGVTFTRQTRRPVIFIDYHHGKDLEDDPRFRDSIAALRAFKQGNDFWVNRLGTSMVTAAAADIQTMITSVVPILGRDDLVADRNSRMSRVAEMIARRFGVRVNYDLFRQTATREGLHLQPRLPFDRRKAQVLEVLRCRGGAGENVILVDDMYTTSGTQEAYIQRIRENFGDVAAVVVLMKLENDEELLNPGLYA